ncbi:MAG TPA: cobalamin biosynthesis protein, partial [bacterium]|nr:cobalamin biosynthesis protein [bacterium]
MRNHAWALVLAFFLDFLLGDPESWPHPVRFIGAGYTGFEHFFRRRGPLTKVQGVVTVLLLAAFSAAVPFLALRWVEPSLGKIG